MADPVFPEVLGGEVDDAAVLVALHRLQGTLRAPDGAIDVDPIHLVQPFRGDLDERLLVDRPRHVGEREHVTQVPGDVIKARQDRGPVRDVQHVAAHAVAGLGQALGLRHHLGVQVDHRHLGSEPGVHLRHAEADALGRSRHDARFALQIYTHVILLYRTVPRSTFRR